MHNRRFDVETSAGVYWVYEYTNNVGSEYACHGPKMEVIYLSHSQGEWYHNGKGLEGLEAELAAAIDAQKK